MNSSSEYWQNPLQTNARDIRLMVKRVFITSDLGEDALPKWASWVKVVVDGTSPHPLPPLSYPHTHRAAAEDLPLNVSRETLQSTRFLKQLRSIVLKHLLALLARIQEKEPEKWAALHKSYGNVFKLGAVEDTKNRVKLAELCRFATNQRSETSLDEVRLGWCGGFGVRELMRVILVGSTLRIGRKGRNRYVLMALRCPVFAHVYACYHRYSTWQIWAPPLSIWLRASSLRSSTLVATRSSFSRTRSTRSSSKTFGCGSACPVLYHIRLSI